MTPGSWPNPPHPDEYALSFDRAREKRVLVVPALFDEANKLRHFTVEVVRALDRGGVDSFLPDLPGTNESLAPLPDQTLGSWRDAMTAAASHFGATNVLTIRGGALVAPGDLNTLQYAPVGGPTLLRGLLRARVMADREAGTESTRDGLLELARENGITLAGYELGAAMVSQLEDCEPPESATPPIKQGEVGGAGLWLRAEPDHDAEQAEALAKIVLERLA